MWSNLVLEWSEAYLVSTKCSVDVLAFQSAVQSVLVKSSVQCLDCSGNLSADDLDEQLAALWAIVLAGWLERALADLMVRE